MKAPWSDYFLASLFVLHWNSTRMRGFQLDPATEVSFSCRSIYSSSDGMPDPYLRHLVLHSVCGDDRLYSGMPPPLSLVLAGGQNASFELLNMLVPWIVY